MYGPVGTVDRCLSIENHRDLTYEWGNYRYASAWMDSSKGMLVHKPIISFGGVA